MASWKHCVDMRPPGPGPTLAIWVPCDLGQVALPFRALAFLSEEGDVFHTSHVYGER